MRIITVTLWTLFLFTPMVAQTYVYGYSGTAAVPKDYGTGYVGTAGTGIGHGSVGVLGHGLRGLGAAAQGDRLDLIGRTAAVTASRYPDNPAGSVGYDPLNPCLGSDCSNELGDAGYSVGVLGSTYSSIYDGIRYRQPLATATAVGSRSAALNPYGRTSCRVDCEGIGQWHPRTVVKPRVRLRSTVRLRALRLPLAPVRYPRLSSYAGLRTCLTFR